MYSSFKFKAYKSGSAVFAFLELDVKHKIETFDRTNGILAKTLTNK